MLAWPIEKVNANAPLKPSAFSIKENEAVLSVCFSPSGSLMASCASTGEIKVYQVSARSDRPSWPLLRILRDSHEAEIEEFFTGCFLGESGLFLGAGKRKSRHAWNSKENDHSVLPGVVKVFDLKSGLCVARFSGVHLEEILYLKAVSHCEFLSCGQDGRLARWKIDLQSRELIERKVVSAGSMIFHLDVCENLIIAAVDNYVKVFTLDTLRVSESTTFFFKSFRKWPRSRLNSLRIVILWQ